MTRRLAVNVPLVGLDLRASCELARRAETLGYTDVWTPETSGCDAFSVASAVGVVTQTVRIGIAVVPVYTRPPALLAMSALAAQQASAGRFCLGLGASSPAIVERWMGARLERPVERIRETVEVVRAALAGEKVKIAGSTVAVDGFKLEQPAPAPVPIFIGALGPRMLQLAAEVADGVALYLASEEGVRLAAKAAPGKEIVERIICCPGEDPDEIRPVIRWLFAPYVAVPAYNHFLARQGFEAEAGAVARAWESGDRDAAREAVSDRLIDAMVVMGPAESCKERLESFREAGLNTPILMFFSPKGPEAFGRALEEMAPA